MANPIFSQLQTVGTYAAPAITTNLLLIRGETFGRAKIMQRAPIHITDVLTFPGRRNPTPDA